MARYRVGTDAGRLDGIVITRHRLAHATVSEYETVPKNLSGVRIPGILQCAAVSIMIDGGLWWHNPRGGRRLFDVEILPIAALASDSPKNAGGNIQHVLQ